MTSEYIEFDDPSDMSRKTYLYYYTITKEGQACLTSNNKAIPNTSAVNFRRLVFGTDDSHKIPELIDPFTVICNGQVIFKLKTKRWIAKIMHYQMTRTTPNGT